jgi:TM2 domain-containing membrane protein YozV
VFCSKCGTQVNEGSAFCPQCGASVGPTLGQSEATGNVSPKSRLATSLLAWFLGIFGAHRFYVGKTGTAVIMLLMGIVSGVCYIGGFFGGLASEREAPIWGLLVIAGVLYFAVWIWMVIDFVMAVTGNFKDSQGKPIKKW